MQAWRESYRELIPLATLDALSVERRTAQWRHTLGNPVRSTFVAEVDGAERGFVSGGSILVSGLATGSEVSSLYLLDMVKRRGEAMRGRADEIRIDRRDGLALDEVAYVRNDLAAYSG